MFWFWNHRREIDLALCTLLFGVLGLIYLWMVCHQIYDYCHYKTHCLKDRVRAWWGKRKRNEKGNDKNDKGDKNG